MADKIRFPMAIKDDTDMIIQDVVKAIREFLTSMGNITLDRLEFEQRKQIEVAQFNDFL